MYSVYNIYTDTPEIIYKIYYCLDRLILIYANTLPNLQIEDMRIIAPPRVKLDKTLLKTKQPRGKNILGREKLTLEGMVGDSWLFSELKIGTMACLVVWFQYLPADP